MATLTRRELTAALAARQHLIERRSLAPAAAIAQLTPLQAQHTTAPHVALAARLDGFAQGQLEAAIDAGGVVKTTIMRNTLHLVATADYPAYAQLSRQTRLRAWRAKHPHLDERNMVAELRAWLRRPRTNTEIRARLQRYEGVPDSEWGSVLFARMLLPLVQLPPAGHWNQRERPRFVVHPGRLPDPDAAAAHVLTRYLGAFGPASRRDVAAWAGVAQRDLAAAWDRVDTVSHHDERGTELLDLPGQPLPPASTRLPVRFLGRWEQPLLAYADRERIIPTELMPLQLTLSGDQTVTVDGRVAASWLLHRHGDAVELTVTSHVEIPRAARAAIRAEGRRTARFCAPDARAVAVVGV
jgi:hypothetical protein